MVAKGRVAEDEVRKAGSSTVSELSERSEDFALKMMENLWKIFN